MIRNATSALALFACVAACSTDPEDPSPGSEETQTTGEWTTLVEGEWTLEAGGEIPELCVTKEFTRDVYIRAIRPVHPPGTHHTLVTQSDGSLGCNEAITANGLLYAAGVGSEGFMLPDGVALKIPAGSVVGLGLHLYNTTTEELSGRSAMEVIEVDASTVEYEAESRLIGPVDFAIPPGEEYTYSSACTLSEEQHVVSIFPHMHQIGRHFKATLVMGGEEEVVHDAPYVFEEQYQINFDEPYHLLPGDQIRSECTWQNTLDTTVGFGESSDREMCFNIVLLYPALGSGACGLRGDSTPIVVEGPPCTVAGDPGNEAGVGQHCTAESNACGEEAFCLAEYVTGDAANFCSKICDTDADCGAGAICLDGRQPVCVPAACAEPFSAESVDGGAG